MKADTVVGIIGAMDSEVERLVTKLQNPVSKKYANIDFHIGEISKQRVVLAKCGVGKVNAARCAQLLIDRWKPDLLINTGIAGGIAPGLSIGDVIIAEGFIQHDFDVSAFGHAKGYLCTGEGKDRPTVFEASEKLTELLTRAASDILSPVQIKKGIVATGDVFLSDAAKKQEIHEDFNAAAAEMEGAAIAQTAYYSKVPFAAIRAISDLADGQAPESFEAFEKRTADISAAIIERSVYLLKEFGRNTNMSNYKSIESALVHGGIYGDAHTGAVNVPIYQTSTYEQESLGKHKGWEYSRTGNPTRAALEALIAELESGKAGFAFASGMAAITAVLSLLEAGDSVIISSNVYGGTFRILDKVFSNFNIRYSIEDTSDLDTLETKISPEVKAILIESPANPLLTITDLAGISGIAKKHGILTIVDNTFMTPYLQRPIELGADIVIHSATKYLGGHSDLIAGLVVVNDDELASRLGFIQNATGGVLGPFDSFLLIRGIKTLGVRMDRHVENAEKAAAYLLRHKAVKKVYYPGLPDAQGYETNKNQAKNGGAMISFELHGNYDIRKFFSSLKLIALAESLGGVESLVCHPATMTHASIPYETRQKVGITDGLIRLSIGIENIDDLLFDLGQAIAESEG